MDISDQLVDIQDPPSKPRRFVFVLLKDFTMLCFFCSGRISSYCKSDVWA